MCGIAGIFNFPRAQERIQKMLETQRERGPDALGVYSLPEKDIVLGHNRLGIIDLSTNANQPMFSHDKRYVMVFNGEIYNYIELRKELKPDFGFITHSDSEVLLCAYQKWGATMLDKLNGMFAMAIYDTITDTLFLARDRFGVKPLYYSFHGDSFIFASEIKAIHASGIIPKETNDSIWALYFANGLYDHSNDTFWRNIVQLPAGSYAIYQQHKLHITNWYKLEDKVNEIDNRSEKTVMDELLAILESSIQYRFRADVPVGICLSGGLDSSLLLALVSRVKGNDYPIHAFTFYTGDERYDELPWVNQMIPHTHAQHHACLLTADEVPSLSCKIAQRMDEPYGGIPTLGMSKVFETAQRLGIKVLLDGNGMDEGWGGYEYYQRAKSIDISRGPIQGATINSHLKEIMRNDGLALLSEFQANKYHNNPLLNLQLRDIKQSKIPRAMRFADRNSMTYSLELREPFLDYRLIELGLRQPIERKITNGEGKYLVRRLASKLIPKEVREAPKRALQTPQREWLSNDLKPWIESMFEQNQQKLNQWFNYKDVQELYSNYCLNKPDNSFYVWQLLNYCLVHR
jgi:asparagine synthase (glutamine-hydrolysing)